jgi:hypothetical protein
MAHPRAARKSLTQWQALVSQYEISGLSVSEFCTTHNIGYVSFCRWRKRIQEASGYQNNRETEAFVNLADFEMAKTAPSQGNWNITLNLGNGMQLTLSQA